MKNYSGPLSLLVIGVLYGLSGVFAKYLGQWLNPYQVVGLRFFIAFILATSLFLLQRKQLQYKKIDKQKLFWFSLTFPVSAIFFTLSVFYTKVSLAVFSFYIANLVSSFIAGALFLKEKVDTKKQIALAFILIALICFTDPFHTFRLDLGFVFGLIAGVIQTAASIFQKIIGKATDRLGLVIIQTFTGVLVAAAAMILTHSLMLPTLPVTAIGVSLIFGCMFLLISYLYLVGFQKTNLNVGSILVSSELLFGPLFAVLFLSEMPTGLELLGGLFTIIAVIFANI